MSAMANMAGLYKPKDDQLWNKTIIWQPIPIHTKEHDKVLLYFTLVNSAEHVRRM